MLKRLVLDVLKPTEPDIIAIAEELSNIEGIIGVNIGIVDMERDVEKIKITIEGDNINFEKVKDVLDKFGAAIHSIDSVAAGKKIIEEVLTPQDRE